MSNVVSFEIKFLAYYDLKFHLKQHFPLYMYMVNDTIANYSRAFRMNDLSYMFTKYSLYYASYYIYIIIFVERSAIRRQH